MKNITFIVGILGNGGAERVISILANNLESSEFNVKIILLYGDRVDYKINNNIEILTLNNTSNVLLFRILNRLKFLYKYFLKFKNDIYISFLYDINIYVLIAAFFTKTKVIISERNDPNQDPQSKFVRKIRNILYRYSSGIVCQTDDAMRYFDFLSNKKTVIFNPLDSNLLNPFKGERVKEIVTASRLDKQKNLKMLINAFSKVVRIHYDYKLKIYGEGQQRSELEKYILDNKLSDKVELMGFSSDLHEQIHKSRLFVISSDYEGISNSMLEALALGIPVIATDCPIGGARMFIKNNWNGILINVGDEYSLVQNMLRIIEDDSFTMSLSSNSVLIREELNEENIIKEWINFINEIY